MSESHPCKTGQIEANCPQTAVTACVILFLCAGLVIVGVFWAIFGANVGLTLALVFVGCAQVLVYLLQAKIMDKQADISGKQHDAAIEQIAEMARAKDIAIHNAQAQLRAYVAVEILKVEWQDVHRKFIFHTDIRNTGQTPALNVKISLEFELFTESIPADYVINLKDSTFGQSVLFPNQTESIPFVPDKMYDRDELYDIAVLGSKLCAFGKVSYSDVFGVGWETWFCKYLFVKPDGKHTTISAERGNTIKIS